MRTFSLILTNTPTEYDIRFLIILFKKCSWACFSRTQQFTSFALILFCSHKWGRNVTKMLPIFQLLPPGPPRSLRRSALRKASAATAPSKSAAPHGCPSSGMPRWIGRSPTPTSSDTWTSFWATRWFISRRATSLSTAAVATCAATILRSLIDSVASKQVNDFRSRGKQLSATEAIFVTATMQFRETIKAMYSLPVSVCIWAARTGLSPSPLPELSPLLCPV